MLDWLTPSRRGFRVGPIPIKTTTPSPSGGWPQQKLLRLLNAGFGIHHGRTWNQKECGCASVGVQQGLVCKKGRRVWRSPSYHSAVIHLSCATFSFICKLMYYIIKYLNVLSEFTMINSQPNPLVLKNIHTLNQSLSNLNNWLIIVNILL